MKKTWLELEIEREKYGTRSFMDRVKSFLKLDSRSSLSHVPNDLPALHIPTLSDDPNTIVAVPLGCNVLTVDNGSRRAQHIEQELKMQKCGIITPNDLRFYLSDADKDDLYTAAIKAMRTYGYTKED